MTSRIRVAERLTMMYMYTPCGCSWRWVLRLCPASGRQLLAERHRQLHRAPQHRQLQRLQLPQVCSPPTQRFLLGAFLLSFPEFSRRVMLNRQDNMMLANFVGLSGDPNPRNLDDWVGVLR